ncbi:cytochrome P450 [Astrocystis sublimbata]|nr:cytochrome P450 [Astrocystis sublimbata]
MASYSPIILILFLIMYLTCRYFVPKTLVGRRPHDYPPGPPTLPIIGNLHQMPARPELMGQQFEIWARKYGSIFSLILGTQTWIVLSQGEVVRDLLDKRGAIYSSRPDAYLAQDIISGGMRSFLMKDGKIFRLNRRIAHVHLSEKASRVYIPYQDLEIKAMLAGFLDQPMLFRDHLKRYTASLATMSVFGFRTVREDDPTSRSLFDSFDKFSEISFSLSAMFLDMFPVLRCLPDALIPAKRNARHLYDRERREFMDLYLAMKTKTCQGSAPPCFARYLVEIQEKEGVSDFQAAYTCGSLLQGNMGSTTESLTGFVKAMILFPKVASASQNELDRVCGNRMPELNDWSALVYTRSCVKETLRWMTASPLGIPHALTANDEYMGYRLPEGATVICNARAIHNDAAHYPDPHIFDPVRWVHDTQETGQAATNHDFLQRGHFAFGAGRRLCQGIHVAERSLFLAMARLLWAFDFRPAVDSVTGREVPVADKDDLQGGIFVTPRPFSAQITPRDPDKVQAIKRAWTDVSGKCLDKDMQWKDSTENAHA